MAASSFCVLFRFVELREMRVPFTVLWEGAGGRDQLHACLVKAFRVGLGSLVLTQELRLSFLKLEGSSMKTLGI